MTANRGVYAPRPSGEVFIGWAGAPAVDRRFLFGAIPLALAATTGIGVLKGRMQDDPGAGAWLTGATHDVEGVLARAPYPMIRVADASSPVGMRTVLVVAQGKCTSALDLAASDAAVVRASGVLIERGERRMLEVPLTTMNWLTATGAAASDSLRTPPTEDLGSAELSGMIMDSKCFFGVMKPARGRTHKACAALCLRGGIPPSFWARRRDGKEAVMLMTDAEGGPLKEEILPFVADPVKAAGRIVRVGDLLHFRVAPSAISRL